MNYSTPYVLLVLFLLILSFLQLGIRFSNASRTVINVIASLVVVFFLGTRGFISTDWKNYYPLFTSMPNIVNLWTYFWMYNLDWGFVIFSSVIKTVSENFHFYVFVNTVVDFLLLSIFFKRYLSKKYYPFFLALFLVYFGLIFEINLMRNIKSLLLFLLSLKYIENRDWKKYFLFNLLGLTFHWTALLLFPLYFFMHKRVALRTFVILFLIGNVLFLFQIPYIKPIITLTGKILGGVYEERLINYVNNDIYGRAAALSFGYLERTLISFLVMYYYNRLLEKSKSNVIFINAFIIFILLALYTREIEIILTRFCALFAFSYWILIPKMIQIAEKRMKAILLVFFSVLILGKTYLMTKDDILFQYDNVLIGYMKTYEEREVLYKENDIIYKEMVSEDPKEEK